jgi:hypothetical protein
MVPLVTTEPSPAVPFLPILPRVRITEPALIEAPHPTIVSRSYQQASDEDKEPYMRSLEQVCYLD